MALEPATADGHNPEAPALFDLLGSESASDAALRQHLINYPQYFSTIDASLRVKWVKDNMQDELAHQDQKRLEFEEAYARLLKEKEEIEAKKLLELRKEVVRLWIRKEEQTWAETKAQLVVDNKKLEESIERELRGLREKKQENLPSPSLYHAGLFGNARNSFGNTPPSVEGFFVSRRT